MQVEPVTLAGRHVRLEPLSLAHVDALAAVAIDAEIWRWTTSVVRTPAELRGYVESALALAAAGSALPFATIDLASGAAVGSTRFGNIEPAHRRVEIGWTWIAPAWQRTALNTEAKCLMLRHAFERWGCLRVEFKTDSLNEKSRRALGRIGAKEEGTLRNHMITPSGRVRHSVYFSIVDTEWPAVKAGLERKLEGRG